MLKEKRGIAAGLVIGIVVVILILGTGGYFAYKNFSEEKSVGDDGSETLNGDSDSFKSGALCSAHGYSTELGFPINFFYIDPENHPQFKLVSLDVESIKKIREKVNKEGVSALNDLSDLTCLEQLKVHGSLTGYDVEVKDISFLSNLKNLRLLDLSNTNSLEDISPLFNLKNLEVLYISNNGLDLKIQDLTSLSNLNKIRMLYLNDNFLIKDISPIKNMVNLEVLHLEGTGVTDLSSLAEKKNLKFLGLPSSADSLDLSPLKDSVGLQILSDGGLSNSEMKGMSVVSNMNNLKVLGVGYIDSSDLDYISNLSNLEELQFRSTSIKKDDLTKLSKIQKLKTISLIICNCPTRDEVRTLISNEKVIVYCTSPPLC